MILTVTLNPAVDTTLEIGKFSTNTVNRIDHKRQDAGGKGINVSKVLKELNIDSLTTGFIGGESGEFIKKHLDQTKIANDFIIIEEATRENIKIVDPIKKTFTDINDPGPFISSIQEESLKRKIGQLTIKNKIVVFSGSIPKGLSDDIYAELIEISKENGAYVILDTYGEGFIQSIDSGPHLIKPNIEELEDYFGEKLLTKEEIIKKVREKLLNKGIESAIVSLGKEGALMIDHEQAFYAEGLSVEVKSTVGAGDAMVAGITYGLSKKYSQEDILRMASAAATANVMTPGSKTGEVETIMSLYKQISIKRL